MALNPFNRKQNPLERYKGELQKKEQRRQQFIKNEERKKLLIGGAAVAGVALGVHMAHPQGIIGAANAVAKYAMSARGATQQVYKESGGIARTIGRAGFNISNPIRYLTDFENFANPKTRQGMDAFSDIGKRWTKEFKERMASQSDTYIDQIQKEINRQVERAPQQYRRDVAQKKVNTYMKSQVNEGSISKEAYDKVQKRMGHRLGDIAMHYKKSDINQEFYKADLSGEGIAEMADQMLEMRRQVYEETKDLDFDTYKTDLREKLIKNLINERQGKTSAGPVHQLADQFKNLGKKVGSYRNATLADVDSYRLQEHLNLTENNLEFINEIIDAGADVNKFNIDSNLLINERTNDLMNISHLNDFKGYLKGEFSQGLIGSMLGAKDRAIREQFRAKPVVRMKSGYHQPGLIDTGFVNSDFRLTESMYGIGNTAYRTVRDGNQLSLEKVKSGLDFTSGRFGATKRFLAQMSGIDAPDWNRKDAPFWESKLFDVARDRPGGASKWKTTLTKGSDPNWTPNKFNRYISEALSEGNIDRAKADEIRQYIEMNASALPKDVIKELGYDIDSQDAMVSTYKKLASELDSSGLSEEALENRALNILERTRVVSNKRLFTHNRIQKGDEILQKDIGRMIIEKHGVGTVSGLANKLMKDSDNVLTNKQMSESLTDYMINKGYKMSTVDNMGAFTAALGNSSRFGTTMSDLNNMLSYSHPNIGFGPVGFDSSFRGDVLATKQFDNSSPTALAKSIVHTMTAGRDSGIGGLSDVHQGTLNVYGAFSRLNDLLRATDIVPMHLTDESMGSTPSILANMFTKRVMPAYGLYYGAKYINDYSNEIDPDGYTIQQRYERAQAHTRLKVAGFKEKTGINSLFRQIDMATPGSEGIHTFLEHAPFQGPLLPLFAAGQVSQFGGILSHKSPEEWTEYYRYGQDPVRKGKFWLLGSQPWMGEGISHHRPNSYKRAMSQWQYTDTVYGSRENFWAHAPIPTPTNPFAPIRRYITDPYWWEKMHKERRPYPVSGGLMDSNTPGGNLINATIGRFLKPQISYTEGADRSEIDDYVAPSVAIGRFTRGDLHLQHFTPDYMTQRNTRVNINTIAQSGIAKNSVSYKGTGADVSTNTRIENINGEDFLIDRRTGTVIGTAEKGVANLGYSYNSSDSGTMVNNQSVPGGSRISDQMPKGTIAMLTDEHDARLLNGNNEYAVDDIGALSRNVSSYSGSGSVGIDLNNKSFNVTETPLKDKGVLIERGGPIQTHDPEDIMDPGSLEYQLDRVKYNFGLRIPGGKAYLSNVLFFGGDDFGEGSAVHADAGDAYELSSRFNNSGIGGRMGTYSEVGRRWLQRERGLRQRVNNLPNQMPNWIPKLYRTGDAYAELPGGEYRLPGEAYESMNELHPDEHGMYGAVDRASILADVAPWSDEFRYWLDVARSQELTPEAEAKLRRTVERTSEGRGKYHFTDYEFLGKEIEKSTVKIDKFLDANRFQVQGSDQVYRFAGIHNSFNSENGENLESLKLLQEKMLRGSEVQLIHSKQYREGTIPTVVYARGENINNMLAEYGAKTRDEDLHIEQYMKMHPYARGLGKAWELLAHQPIPIVQSKILNVRSPFEHYKETNLYGVDFQDWQRPIDKMVKPLYQNAWAKGPFKAGGLGAFYGMMIGGILGTPGGAKAGAAIGAFVGTAGSTIRKGHELKTGQAWIPKSRQKERDINKYYDRIKYLKHKRLYYKYAELAEKEEGIDLEELISEMEQAEKEIKGLKKHTEAITDKIQETGMYKGKGVVKTVNNEGRVEYKLVTDRSTLTDIKNKEGMEEVRKLESSDLIANLGPFAQEAIKHRQEFRATMFGLDKNATVTEIMRALPSTEREYFPEFVQEEDPEKQDEILKFVPEDTGRALRMMWGRNYEDPEPIDEFLNDYYLPDKDWIGWKEGVDLETSKAKTIENVGEDPKDFGIWRNFSEQEKLTPTPNDPYTHGYNDSNTISIHSVRKNIDDILSEYDITNTDIQISSSKKTGINVEVDIMQDLKDETRERIKKLMVS